MGPLFALCSDLQNTRLHAKDEIFKLVNIDIILRMEGFVVL